MKVGQNIKYDWQILYHQGIEMAPVDDTMMMSYVLDGSTHKHNMDELSQMFLGHQPVPYSEVCGKGKNQITFDYVPLDKALGYAAEDADITLRLYHVLKPRLAQEKMVRVYEDIERPIIPVIARMEYEGIKVDPAILKQMSEDFGKKLIELERDIHQIAGHEFNVASPKQVGQVLFDEMGIEGGKKTKTGDWSTAANILEELSVNGVEIVDKILEYRQLAKLKSTYTDALQQQIVPDTGRVHTSFHLAGTTTGRLSSSDPNLQNIPIRTEEGRKIREAFIANDGHAILSVDYSQVELRLAAEIAGVEALKEAFRDGVDIHTLTASRVFGVPLEEVTPEIRRQAKAVNFGIIYGISGWGLAKQLGCGPGEANDFIKRYLTKFSEIQDYMEAKKEEGRQHGYVKTLHGRKCYVGDINNKMPMRRMGAERQAINAPLQGTAADILKIAMAIIPQELDKEGLSAKMLVQVHDELLFEVPDAELERTTELVVKSMERAATIGIDLSLPLKAEAGSGKSWSDAH
jgi:DNA polymerase-1